MGVGQDSLYVTVSDSETTQHQTLKHPTRPPPHLFSILSVFLCMSTALTLDKFQCAINEKCIYQLLKKNVNVTSQHVTRRYLILSVLVSKYPSINILLHYYNKQNTNMRLLSCFGDHIFKSFTPLLYMYMLIIPSILSHLWQSSFILTLQKFENRDDC